MKLTEKQHKIIDIIQWICIIFLLVVCISGYIFKNSNKDDFIKSTEYQKEQTYIKIYESQKLESLKNENKSLHDSIKKLSNVESAVEIKYIYKYKTDTIKVENIQYVDSTYHYAYDNDTLSYNIDVKAKDLEWLKSDFKINDKFTLINREKDGNNQLIIEHGENTTITNVDAWHRVEDKQKWYKNFHIGIQAGVGYGVINNKPDIFIGVGVSYKLK